MKSARNVEKCEPNPMEHAGKEEIVTLAILNVDYNYQRAIKPHHKRIAKNWNPQKSGRLIVSRRSDGSLYILDGQQRREAMLSLGILQWKAIVHEVRDVQHEAELFSALNGGEGTSKGLTFREIYKARLVAEDPIAISVKFVVEKNGLLINHRAEWPNIGCIQSLYGLCQNKGAEHLNNILEVLTKAWPENAEALEASFILGCSKILCVPQIDPKRLIKRLSETSPLVLSQTLMGMGGKSGVGVAGRLYTLMASRYNKGLKNRIPEILANKRDLPS